MTEAGKWRHLSVRARALLDRSNSESTVGDPPDKVRAFLENLTCPPYPAFVRYFTHYAGLKMTIPWRQGPLLYSFPSLADNVTCLRWDRGVQEWRLYCCQQETAPVKIEMKPDGTLVCNHGRGRWSDGLASSIEKYIENLSIKDTVERNADLVVDFVQTGCSERATRLAHRHGLTPVPEASDQYVQWWMTETCGIRLSVTGSWRPADKMRRNVLAFWPRRDAALDDQFTEELTGLVEPHFQFRRRLPGFRASRDRPVAQADFQEVGRYQEAHPAHSFRVFARRWLTALAQGTAAIAIPPDAETLFEAYLVECHATAKRLGNTRLTYYAAVGLAAFGHQSVLEDILDHLPRGEDSCWDHPLWAGQYLEFLLPNDAMYCPVEETEKLRSRLRARPEPLRWYAAGGFFY
jgi:hypothetical protein